MAEELLDTYMENGGRERHHHLKRCETDLRPIWGGDGMNQGLSSIDDMEIWERFPELPVFQRKHLWEHYGEHLEGYLEADLAEDGALELLVEGEGFCRGEIDLAVYYGQARSTADVLKRRSTLFYKDPNHGLEIAPFVSERIAELLGFDADWVEADLATYRAEVALSQRWRNPGLRAVATK
jgi:glycerol-3-phosphate dehydrogenase